MNLLHDKKKRNKNIFKTLALIVLSFHIHFAIFMFFLNYTKNTDYNYKKINIAQNSIKITLLKKDLNSNHNKSNVQSMEKKSTAINKLKDKKVEKKTDEDRLKTKKLNPLMTQEVQLAKSLETNSNQQGAASLPKKEGALINPFGELKLPRNLLGQNLFPKKYQANFKITQQNGDITDFSFIKLIPSHEISSFLDQSVEKAFEKQILNLPKENLIQWLDKAKEINYADPMYPNSNSGNLVIVLEFQEPN